QSERARARARVPRVPRGPARPWRGPLRGSRASPERASGTARGGARRSLRRRAPAHALARPRRRGLPRPLSLRAEAPCPVLPTPPTAARRARVRARRPTRWPAPLGVHRHAFPTRAVLRQRRERGGIGADPGAAQAARRRPSAPARDIVHARGRSTPLHLVSIG